MTEKTFAKVALVGRPNVGKSTLFNRFLGKSKAIVDSTPGLTRDRQEAKVNTEGTIPFSVIDTAGFEHREASTMQAKMWDQTEKAIQESDAVLFIVDGVTGITAQDEAIAKYLREKNKPVICIVNKGDVKKAEETIFDAYSLGFSEPVLISAAHGHGMEELYQAIKPYIEKNAKTAKAEDKGNLVEESIDEKQDSSLQLAIIGRPNVGKSSLLNAIIEEERLLVGEEAGVTRDSIFLNWVYKGTNFELIDTAGLRKSARRTDIIERLSAKKTQEAIQFAPIVVVLLDITRALEKQDLTIVHNVYKEGRCVVIGLNKWDLVKPYKRDSYIKYFKEQLGVVLPQAEGIPFVPLSAKKRLGLRDLFNVCLNLYKVWQKKIPTSRLNEWLEEVLSRHQPPLVRGRRLKIRYITQKKARPPTFLLFVNIKEGFPESYIRYMQRQLRQAFDFPGVPVRFLLKKGENPYHKKD